MLLVLAAASTARAGEAARVSDQAEAAPAEVRFRRVYAPADRLSEWPLGRMRYLRMEPERFEQLVKAAGTPGRQPGRTAGAIVAAAHYEARLDEQNTLSGRAVLDVEAVSPAPGILVLEPCNLAVRNALWLDQSASEPPAEQPGDSGAGPDAGRPGRPAMLGLGPAGALAVRVERSGRLEFQWSRRGDSGFRGALQFNLEIPRCAASSWVLELPGRYQPLVDGGLLIDEGMVDENLRRWRLEAGGRTKVQLRLVPTDQAPAPRAVVRESTVYEISRDGLLVAADLGVEVFEEPVSRLVLSWEGPLKLVRLTAADQPARWISLAGANGRRRVLVELPQPWQRTAAMLRVRAAAPLELEQPWRLPRIRIEQLAWQEGEATVRVISPLTVQGMALTECRQTAIGTLGSPPGGESLQFQYFTSNAGIELQVGQEQAVAQIQSATGVEVSEEESTAKVVAELKSAGAAVCSFQAELGPQWLIQTVESVPPEALDDWAVERDPRGRRHLSFRFARPLPPGTPLRIVVTARRLQWPLTRALGLVDLVPLRFSESGGGRHLVAVHAAPPYQLELVTAEPLELLQPEQLTAAEQALFAEPPTGWLFEYPARPHAWEVVLRKKQGGYRARTQTIATVEGTRLREEYRLQITPQAGPVDRLRVRFFPAKNVPPQFRLKVAGPEGSPLRFQRESPPAASAQSSGEETWELVLPRPLEEPFEIIATREEQMTERRPISLAWLADAVDQQARLAIHCDRPDRIRTRNVRLEPVPVAPAGPGRYSTVCAAYRYAPGRHGAEAAVEVARVSHAPTAPLWVWNAQLQSWYHPSGRAEHLATYWLEAGAKTAFRARLPAGLGRGQIQQVLVGGRPARWQIAGNPPDVYLTVELPEGERFPVVEVNYITTGPGLQSTGRCTAPRLISQSPVLAESWSVWLPPGYRAVDGHARILWPDRSSPSILQRLFGPLARPTDQAPPDPLHPTDSVPALAHWHQRRQAAEQAAEWLGLLGQRASQLGRPAAGDLARLLLGSRPRAVELLIDMRCMEESGVQPDRLVPALGASDATRRGAELLRDLDLTLLVTDRVFVLADRRFAALLGRWLEPLDVGPAYWVEPGPLAEYFQQAADTGGNGRLVPVDRWAAASQGVASAWPAATWGAMSDGWSLYQVALSPGSPGQLAYVHSDEVRLWGWAAFLVVCGACWWLAGRQASWLFWGLCGAVSAALLVPEPMVAPATGAALAALGCGAVRLMQAVGLWPGRLDRSLQDSTIGKAEGGVSAAAHDRSPTDSTANYLALVLLAACCAWTGPARAAEDAGGAPGSPQAYRVFIPIDENRQPTGERYFVPEPLYRELFRRQGSPAEGFPQWLLGGARYRGVLSRDARSGKLRVDELKASFSLHVFGAPAEVRVPFRRSGAGLVPDGALLDGRLVQVDWAPGGEALVLEVDQPGDYRLDLALRPVTFSSVRGGGFDLAIPPLADSRVELVLPPGAPPVEIPSALGAVEHQAAPPQVIADLGPCEKLSVRWSSTAGQETAGSPVEVEQLIYLRVRPGTVVVETALEARTDQGAIDQLRLAVDPRLRMLPPEGEKPAATIRLNSPAEGPQTLTVRWAEPVSEVRRLRARFLLTGTSGIGRLGLPLLEVEGARTVRRWVAVSVEPSLDYQFEPTSQWETVEPPALLARWALSGPPPVLAGRLSGAANDWQLVTAPRMAHTTAEQSLAWTFDDGVVDLTCRARLSTSAGSRFRYRISAPPGLEVRELSIQENGVERLARWWQHADGTITLFLSAPASESQQLLLKGRLRVRARGRFLLPEVKLIDLETARLSIELYRRSAVMVSVDKTSGLSRLETAAPQRDDARLVARYQVDSPGAAYQCVLALSPNRPTVDAELITWVHPEGPQWAIQIDCRLQVAGGVLDRICLNIPEQLGGPYSVQPDSIVQRHPLPEGRALLVVTPAEPITGPYDCTLTARLQRVGGQRLRAPNVTLYPARRLSRFVALPRQTDGRSLVWEVQGLRPAAPPTATRAPEGFAPFTLYEVTDERFDAVVRASSGMTRAARVILADIRLAVQPDRRYWSLATFDIEPGGNTQCPLWLPTTARLIQVRVAGRTVLPRAINTNTWMLPLSASQLPQRIEVLSAGRLPERDNEPLRFQLGSLPVEQTLWTIWEPGRGLSGGGSAASPQSACRQEMIRLKSIASVLQSGARLVGDDPDRRDPWYTLWANRLVAARLALERQLALLPPGREKTATWRELRAIHREQLALAERLGTTEVLLRAADHPPPSQWLSHALTGGTWRVHRFSFTGSRPVLSLELPASQGSGLPLRAIAALAVLALAVAARWAWHRGALLWLVKKWPHPLLAVAGIVWWMFFKFAVFGWLLLAAAVVLALGLQWRRPRSEPGSSRIAIDQLAR